MKVGVVFISCDSKGFTDAMNGYLVCNGPDYDIWVQSLASYLQDLVPHVGGNQGILGEFVSFVLLRVF